jgi:hypothetical protein
MPPKSTFANGWTSEKAAKLMQQQLPDKVRCSICKRVKTTTTYSNKQIMDLRHHLQLGYDINHSPIKCRKCAQTQNQELSCAVCNETKALDGFSKAQRRNPDRARCLECVNDHLATRAVQKEDWEGYSSAEDEDDTEYGSEGGSNPYESYDATYTASDVDGVSSSMNKLTMQNLGNLAGPGDHNHAASEAFSGIESERGTKGNVPARSTENNPDGSVWREYANVNAKSANAKTGTEYTGWDSRGNAFQRVRAPSTVMSDEYGFNSARAPRSSGFAKVKSDARTFAKAPRGPSPPPPSVSSRVVAGRQVRYDDSETDEEFAVI